MNVIIVMSDTLRRDHVGCYGNTWIKTPNMDRFAQESMVFDRAVPEALPTLPVRRALLTGMRVFPFTKEFFASKHETRAARTPFLGWHNAFMPGWEGIPWDLATLPEMIKQKPSDLITMEQTGAYRTAMITDTAPYFNALMNYHRGFDHYDFIRGHETDPYGVPSLAKRLDLDRWIPPYQKNTEMEAHNIKYLANTQARWRGEADHFAPQTFQRAIDWLEDSREAEDPFFLLVDTWDPHEPFDPPKDYVDLYDPGYEGVDIIQPGYGPSPSVLMTEKEIKHVRALYAGKVTMVDTWFGKFMDKVRELSLLENTLIIVTSDHGGQLGEHGLWGKCPAAMYNQVIDCVLMIRHPEGIGAGQRSDALVQHPDICATVVNALDLTPPYELDGRDLMPILRGEKRKVRDYATCGYVLHVWCREGDHVLICRANGEEPQLFDMKNDPDQLQDIAPDHPEIVKRLYGLVLGDAHDGPIAPSFKRRDSHTSILTAWMDWSPFTGWPMSSAFEARG
ncbi:MAG: sulfatase [Chloroflexi bacterium]|nr:sulfatase [Chloroflexota bacterium]